MMLNGCRKLFTTLTRKVENRPLIFFFFPSRQRGKIIDKINEKLSKKETFIAFEYFPPRTNDGVKNLCQRFTRMAQQSMNM